MSVRSKIHKLEEKVLNPVEFGTSKIALENDAEIALHEEATLIVNRISNGNGLTPNETFIVEQALRIAYLRAIDVFLSVMKAGLCGNDKLAFGIFTNWFGWFMQESARGITQFLEESKIYDQKGKSWKQKEAEAQELYKTWHNPFTRESFEQFIKEGVKNHE